MIKAPVVVVVDQTASHKYLTYSNTRLVLTFSVTKLPVPLHTAQQRILLVILRDYHYYGRLTCFQEGSTLI